MKLYLLRVCTIQYQTTNSFEERQQQHEEKTSNCVM